ncbi:MAG TPA: YihY/virulence factor BrkB family protein [Devosiaceae bacterium]|jgi:membrane protein|nr:YihY/virulence factor BrkB family protein [Devosiaceae bacterium]
MGAAKSDWRREQAGRGRQAAAPHKIPARGWKDILWRTVGEVGEDNVPLVAAGVTFFLLLSLVPALSAFVSLYGLFNDPTTVSEQLSMLEGVVPGGGMELLEEQLARLSEQGGSTLGWALALSLGLALWSASAGVKALFQAMNVAYEETEERNFIKFNALALLFTLAGLVAAVAMIGVILVLPLVLGFIGLGEGMEWLVQGLGYLLVLVLLVCGVSALYRFGPSRRQAKWRWITPGAVLAVVIILAVSLVYSWYAANLANFDATYGSLGALIGFLMWMWISTAIVIVGAEIDAETEHQTARDSTIGEDRPMGSRDAAMADTLGKASMEEGDATDDASARSPEWQAGYAAAREEQQRGRPRPSMGTLAFTLPAALMLSWLERRRRQ